jgi:hypothetical protein
MGRAAAASTWTCGEKFVNNELCMATGLVAPQTITHATNDNTFVYQVVKYMLKQ